jgi:hypothetical protein
MVMITAHPAIPQALVHFVGIIAFTMQPTPPPIQTLRAHSADARMTAPSATKTTSAAFVATSLSVNTPVAILPHTMLPGIPKHMALILFRACDYLGSTGWNTADLQRDGLLYVVLNHDYIAFDTGGAANDPFTIPSSLPHAKPATLPNSASYDLVTDYQPPYFANASVVRLSAGTSSVCATTDGRFDTTVALNNNGALLITAASGNTLRLRGNAHISIENVPFSVAQTLQDPVVTGPITYHYMEYCAMAGIDPEGNDCQRPQVRTSDPPAPLCIDSGEDMLSARTVAGIMAQHPPDGDPHHGNPNHGMSADCSNTAWP